MKVILIGGGGHARSILDSIKIKKEFEVVGIIAQKEKIGEQVDGISIIGSDDDLVSIYRKGIKNAVLGIGSVGIPILRQSIYIRMKEIGYHFPNIVDDTAIIGQNSLIGEGTYIGKGTIINAGSHIGTLGIINTGSIIEHDCEIGDFVHIAPGVTMCGNTRVGSMTHIGAGATIIQGKCIGEHCIIGCGSVVVSDISKYMKAYGNPCKEVEKIE